MCSTIVMKAGGEVAMSERPSDIPPQTLARVGGALYLFIIVGALFGEVFVRGRLIGKGEKV
jgi:hypothetical protein